MALMAAHGRRPSDRSSFCSCYSFTSSFLTGTSGSMDWLRRGRCHDAAGKQLRVGDVVAWTGRFGSDTVARPSEMGVVALVKAQSVRVVFLRGGAADAQESYDLDQRQIQERGILKVADEKPALSA
eukprot:CAMPEP_0178377964 /NCGR_PEP_ID=MMETSP0689_2-20121128/4185_1 /TAXON_ID=160604 /ORGANISM="Amphidinium massartii, Strain CS-259" /LENGTH=125 /DNA_ID=CAMNT_0019998025 /DNA_START=55 /DNA_END=432 /DNA_ORIENTATION=+